MTGQPQNPFANLPTSGQLQVGGQGGGANPPSGSGDRRAINRFTKLEFSGTAMDLFGIKLINIILIAVTVGIWIPWARVRNRRFFYNNTRILDDGLDYLATGFDLFKGWVVVTIILLAFYALPMLGVPFLQEGLSVLLLLVYPWALNKSLRFNARNLAWRDVRFDFHGSYLGSLWNFFLFPVIGILTLGLLLPMASRSMRDYIASRYSFGTAGFFSESSLGAYYGAGLKTLLLFLALFFPLMILLISTAAGAIIDGVSYAGEGNDSSNLALAVLNILMVQIHPLAFPLTLGFIFMVTGAYYRALTRNIMLGSLRLKGGVRFRSTVSGLVLAWIVVTNLLLVIVSVGLLLPWAQVRQYKYLTENTEIRPITELTGFIDRQSRAGHSVGDAVGEAGDIEVSF